MRLNHKQPHVNEVESAGGPLTQTKVSIFCRRTSSSFPPASSVVGAACEQSLRSSHRAASSRQARGTGCMVWEIRREVAEGREVFAFEREVRCVCVCLCSPWRSGVVFMSAPRAERTGWAEARGA